MGSANVNSPRQGDRVGTWKKKKGNIKTSYYRGGWVMDDDDDGGWVILQLRQNLKFAHHATDHTLPVTRQFFLNIIILFN